MNGLKKYLLVFVLACISQSYTYSQDVVKVVMLEGVDIHSVADDFDTEAFIEKVKSDSSFYLAFKALNYYPSTYNAWLKVFKNNDTEKGHVIRLAERYREGNLMWVDLLNEEIKGKIKKKNGEYKYTTAEAWDEVFFPQDKSPVNMIANRDFEKDKEQSTMDRYKNDVKQMMFNPGLKVDGIPLIGKKMGIFEEDMIAYYIYSVYYAHYKDSIDCLVFEAEVIPDYRPGKTVIKSLVTYFEEDSFEVMKREVRITYYSLPIDFDIVIEVDNQIINGVLIPERIYYNGFFDIPFNKKENIEFLLHDFDYHF